MCANCLSSRETIAVLHPAGNAGDPPVLRYSQVTPVTEGLDEQHGSELALEMKAVHEGPLGHGNFAEHARNRGQVNVAVTRARHKPTGGLGHTEPPWVVSRAPRAEHLASVREALE